jgi:class 3 adenylate cyclase
VLLSGETGTGKGLAARVIHDSGPRSQGPLIEVNCAAIPENLLEAELFGYEAGAFTDARQAKPGLFEAASRGTLFLDEIDALPLVLQGKLLTAIEAKRVRRVGAVVERPVDVKLIAATPVDLAVRMADGRFRADLYHRLAVVLLHLPPLRERGDDVLALAQQLLHQYTEAHGLSPKRLSRAAETWLLAYEWPGNVRELHHLMERVTLLSTEAIVDPQTLQRLCLPRPQPAADIAAKRGRGDTESGEEAERIQQALIQAKGNVTRAARLLGWSRKALRYRMRKYGVPRPSKVGKPMLPSPRRGEGQGEGASAHQDARRVVLPSEEAMASTPGWEQKPVALLALELTWPDTPEVGARLYDLWTLATRWEQTLVEKIQGFGGVVLQRPPSLLTAAFGIPHTLEQLPQRAVQTALALRHLVIEAPDGEPCPQLRQAVHWGQLLVDVQASDPAARLLPIGETLGRPLRLLGQAAPGEILVSSEMGRLVEGWCELRAKEVPPELGPPDQPVTYTVAGLRPQPAWLVRHDARPLSRFVGRVRELAILHELLAPIEEGQGQVVGLVGEPGVGKSRLCYEFARGHQPHGWLVLETSADSYGKATPYLPVIDLLKTYFQIADRDDVSTIRDKVIGKLLTPGASLQAMMPAFLALLEVPVGDPTWQSLDPPQRRQRTLEAMKWLLLRESQVQPVFLIVENLHWIDTETQAFLDRLVEGLPAARILLLVSYRSEYQHAWGSKTYYAQLRLDPLPLEHAHELVTSLLGDDVSLAPLKQRLIGWTEGNPFFLEESVRSLVEMQVLVGEHGVYRLATALPSLQVPTTVEAVIAARIDRLPPEAKHLLQCAAVIGKDVLFSLLQAIAELPEEALRRGLACLQAAEFLYETGFTPEHTYTFKHALTHEVAYAGLLHELRRTFHARIVEAIETRHADRLSEQLERLAHHALRGELWEKAVTYLRQASTKARARSASREAGAYLEQALAALEHLPENRQTSEQTIDVAWTCATPCIPLESMGGPTTTCARPKALPRPWAIDAGSHG